MNQVIWDCGRCFERFYDVEPPANNLCARCHKHVSAVATVKEPDLGDEELARIANIDDDKIIADMIGVEQQSVEPQEEPVQNAPVVTKPASSGKPGMLTAEYVCPSPGCTFRHFHAPSVATHQKFHRDCAVGSTLALLPGEVRCTKCGWPCLLPKHIDSCTGYPTSDFRQRALARHQEMSLATVGVRDDQEKRTPAKHSPSEAPKVVETPPAATMLEVPVSGPHQVNPADRQEERVENRDSRPSQGSPDPVLILIRALNAATARLIEEFGVSDARRMQTLSRECYEITRAIARIEKGRI